MDKQGISTTLRNHKCLTCGNLTYLNWYKCTLGKHTRKNGFLNMGKLKRCDNYIRRVGSSYDSCKEQECMFWCNVCPASQKKDIKSKSIEKMRDF